MKKLIFVITAICSVLQFSLVQAEEAFEYKQTPVKGPIIMLSGAGGNIAVLKGDQGILVVDDGFDKNSAALKASLSALGEAPQYLLNTHWHGDHTGANATLGDATIVAHDNVRLRLIKGSERAEPAPAAALPDITYSDGMTIHFGGQTVSLMHFPKSHTDGDSVIFFEPAHVVHMGDLMFAGSFPFVDTSSGGSVAGYIKSLAAIIEKLDDDSVVIPGHGRITNLAGVKAFQAMIVETSATISKMKAAGKTKEQAQAAGLGSKWKGWGDFFIDEERWINTLWAGVE
jgi:cyclase